MSLLETPISGIKGYVAALLKMSTKGWNFCPQKLSCHVFNNHYLCIAHWLVTPLYCLQ